MDRLCREVYIRKITNALRGYARTPENPRQILRFGFEEFNFGSSTVSASNAIEIAVEAVLSNSGDDNVNGENRDVSV